MLKIENLHKIYGKYHALSGLNMTVREGALYGFVGPNGAGKTTAKEEAPRSDRKREEPSASRSRCPHPPPMFSFLP